MAFADSYGLISQVMGRGTGMKQNVKVSIIVPVYNVAEYLDQCILSILGQTYHQLEIVLVDDGSTDASGEICDRYREQDNRIVVIHKVNEGLVKARKTAISRATGKYVCYVDGDDWIESDLIECMLWDMKRTNGDMVVSGYYRNSEHADQKTANRLEEGIYDVDTIIPMMLYTGEFYEFGVSQFVWAKLFRRDVLFRVQMQVDDRIFCGEDVAVTYPYILQVCRLYCSDYCGYHYRQRMNSMTNVVDGKGFMGNKVLLSYLRHVFSCSTYAHELYGQLNQYAKNLFLTRQIECLDTPDEQMLLRPFGGIGKNARVIIYGAGKLGQSIYFYLKRLSYIEIVDWLDKNHLLYENLQYHVNSPEQLKAYHENSYDFIIIAVNRIDIAEEIRGDLRRMGIKEEKMKCLSKEFLDEEYDILDTTLCGL